MSNNVEYFHKNIYLPNDHDALRTLKDEDLSQINSKLTKEFLHLIPDSKTFKNYLEYELPSLDKMYDNNELGDERARIFSKSMVVPGHHFDGEEPNQISIQEMHDEFATLMIDTFNMHSYDPYLRQLTILLICRYHSERAEFIRNLDRTILFFDKNDWMFY